MALLIDLEPLRTHRAYRSLYLGFALSSVGSTLAVVVIGLQVYALTRSTAAVGLVGLFALVPLVVMGLYGGSLVDHHDRRVVGLVAQLVAWAASIGCAVQAWLGNDQVWVLYLLVAVSNGAFGVISPARSSIYPRILRPEQLPAANALSVFAMNVSLTVGPLLAALLVDAGGFRAAYTVDVLLASAAIAGLASLPPIPPEGHEEGRQTRAGLRSVVDGLSFLATRPNVRMTFVVDILAMVLAQPRVLFPAAGAIILGGGARTVGELSAAAAVGGVAAMLLSGPLGRVRRQGVAILVAIVGWGLSMTGFGLALMSAAGRLDRSTALVLALGCMMLAGASDSVSAVFRTTILQSATPDHLRGRLQGIFVVVVAGGPRLGELGGGLVAERIGEGQTALLGGLLVVAAMGLVALLHRSFLRYDAEQPVP